MTTTAWQPIVVTNPPMVMDVTDIQRPFHHNVVLAIAYHLKEIGRDLAQVTPALQSLMDHIKRTNGVMGALDEAQESLVAEAVANRSSFLANCTDADNVVFIDQKLYASRFYTLATPAKSEEEAMKFVEATSIMIGATVNKIIRRMEAERGVSVRTHAVVTSLTEQPVQATTEEDPGGPYSPVLLEARKIDSTWWVLAVVLDDVEAKPDPTIAGALSIVREAVNTVWHEAQSNVATKPTEVAQAVPVT